MNFSQNKEDVFGLIDESSLITMIGTTGSGKSQLLFSYFDDILPIYKTYEFSIRAFDVVRVDYYFKDPHYEYVAEHRRYGEQMRTGLDEDLITVKNRISGNSTNRSRIFIHINECDIMASDDKEIMLELCRLVSQHGQSVKVQLLYETSRPTEDVMPKELCENSDLRIMGHVASERDLNHFMPEAGAPPNMKRESREYYTCSKSGEVNRFDLKLLRNE